MSARKWSVEPPKAQPVSADKLLMINSVGGLNALTDFVNICLLNQNNAGRLGLGMTPIEVLDIIGSVRNTDAYVFSDSSTQVEGIIPQSFEWNVNDVTFKQNFSIAAQDTDPSGLFFRPDGLKMYMVGQQNTNISEYDLSIPGDISTAVFLQSFSLAAQDNAPSSPFFRSDGKKMYVMGLANDSVLEYDLSTAWDISTAVFLQSFDVSAQDNAPRGVCFRPDGLKMYTAGSENASLYEYDLSTAWDISTSVFLHSFSVFAQGSIPLDLVFRPDGRVMYVQSFGGSPIHKYILLTPYDISTAVFQQTFSLIVQDNQMFGFFFDSKGEKLYSAGITNNSIFEYDVGTLLERNLQVGTSSQRRFLDVKGSTKSEDAYVFSDDSTQVEGIIPQSFVWNLNSVNFKQSLLVSAQDDTPEDVFFRPDGLKMYLLGEENLSVYEYDLSVPGDISTASFLQSFSISAQDNAHRDLCFRQDGTKMYTVGGQNDSVYEYDLSTAWDITTLVFLQSFDVGAQEAIPFGLFIRPDGTKLYVVGNDATEVIEYDLFTPWDIASATFLHSFDVSAQDNSLEGVFFQPNGHVMYVLGSDNNSVYEYDLSTPWDVSTAVFRQDVSLLAQDSQQFGFFFDARGEKLYTIGATNLSIFEYDVGTILPRNLQVGTSPKRKLLDVKGSTKSEDAYLFSDDSTQVEGLIPQSFEWNLNDVNFKQSFSVAAQDVFPTVIFFRADGLKMYTVGVANASVYEYDLTTPGDISTATFLQSFSISAQDTAPTGLFFRSDGLKMYTTGTINDDVYEYDLPTPWDISTAVFLQFFSISAQDATAIGVFFRPDGKKLYVLGSQNDNVYEYDLSIAWDVSTSIFLQSFSISAQDTAPSCIFFRSDGLKMYFIGTQNDSIYEYNLITPWDISTAKFQQSISLIAQDTQMLGFFFDSKGEKLYGIGTTNDSVYEYDVGTILQRSLQIGTSPQRKILDVKGSIQNTDAYLFSDDSTQVEGLIPQSFEWNLNDANFRQSFSLAAQETTMRGIFLRPDGFKMYVVGTQNDSVYEYDLSTAGDISTAVFLQSFSITAQEAIPLGVFFRSDGLKMYIAGDNADAVHEYDLTTAWDISTLVFLQSVSTSAQDNTIQGVFLHPDGKKMYFIGSGNDNVYEYDLSIPWNISTAIFLQSFSVAAQEAFPTGVFFRPDGKKMYVIGSASDNVNEYNLITPWDISTASFQQSFSVLAQDGSMHALFFNSKGEKLYTVGAGNNSVYEYDIGAILQRSLEIGSSSQRKLLDVKGSIQNTDAYLFSDGTTQVEGLIPQSFEWNLDDVNFRQSFSVAVQDTDPTEVFFRHDGLKMYVVGSQFDEIHEYDLSVPYDVSTAVFLQDFSVSAQDGAPSSVFFRADGLKMYVMGALLDNVHEYDLSVPWDISTAVFLQSFSVAAEDTLPAGLFFHPDGLKMYTTGITSDTIHEYDLSIPWDISTSILLQSFSVAAQDTDPLGVFFRSDGKKVYMSGSQNDSIFEYDLITPWDISTAVFLQSFSVSDQDSSIQGSFFHPDGRKIYVMGSQNNRVYEYDMGILSQSMQIGTSAQRKLLDVKGSTKSEDAYLFPDGTTQVEGLIPHSLEWNLNDVAFRQSFSVTTQDATPEDVFFRSDGLKMYVIGFSNQSVFEYDLSTAWDVSTAVILQNFSITAQDTFPRGIFFRHDGLKMYFVGDLNNRIFEYDLSTAWDVSTAVFLHSFLTSGQDTNPAGLFFRSDGFKMYLIGFQNNNVYEYDLSTPWDVSTAIFLQSFSVSAQDTSPAGIFFRPDGFKMYVMGAINDSIFEYDLSIPWDVSTAVFQQSVTLIAQDNEPRGLFFRSDGFKVYVTGDQNNNVYEYDVGTILQNSLQVGTPPQRKLVDVIGSISNTDAYVFSDSSTQVEGAVSFPFGWDVTTSVFLQSFSVVTQDDFPTGLTFRPDGLKMYVAGNENDSVYEYDLSIAWDVSTAVFLQSFDVSAQETIPLGICFRHDGLKMYVVGTTNDNVNEYDLSTAWDISTSVFLHSFSIVTQDSLATGVFFRVDGKKMYVVGIQNDNVYEYDLSIPWNVSTSIFLQSHSVTAQDNTPTDIFFRADGKRMYIVGEQFDSVYEYDLSIPWDISTATFQQSFSISAQDATASGLFFRPNGNKMYVVGEENDTVYEYDLGLSVDGITKNTTQIMSGRLLQNQGIQLDLNSVATATLILGQGNFFELIDTGGGGSLSFIDSTGWQAGSQIHILNISGGNISLNDGTGSDAIHITGGSNLGDDDVLSLVFNGTQWFEISRS